MISNIIINIVWYVGAFIIFSRLFGQEVTQNSFQTYLICVIFVELFSIKEMVKSLIRKD